MLGIAFAARIALAGIGRPITLWAAVFPLGMYSAASERLAPLAGWHALHDVARAFLWIGLAAWGASLAANVLALRR
jgi:tellurite resistance protein TehA-like permease